MFGLSRKNKSDSMRQWYEEERARTASGGDAKAFEFIERVLKLPIHKFTDYNSYLEAGSKRLWAAFRACHITAGVLVKTQFSFLDGKGQTLVRPDAMLQNLITDPNPYDSWEELVYVWTFHMKLTGNAYWLKDEMDGRGRPLALYPLMPQYVEPIPDPKLKVAGYRYTINGRVLTFDASEVIHFRRPSPRDSIMGIGDIESAEPLFNDAINRTVFDEKFMENGASPSGVLIKEEQVDDEDAWQKFKAWWDKSYSGKRNIGKTAFLNGKWTYQQLGLTAAQMQSLEKERLSVNNIFTAMGVPLSVAGIERAANYATAKQDDINFRKYECVPLIDILAGKINGSQGFLRGFAEGVKLDYSLAGLIDVEQVVREYQPLVRLGVMTPNELRVMCGLTKSEDPLHDQYYIEGGLVPLEMAGLSEPPPDELMKVVGGLTKGG